MKKIIIAGAGLGGISTAISLKSLGYDVEIFEKNSHIGGRLNIHENEGFKFDLGPSIIIMPQIFKNLFRKVNLKMEDYFKLVQINPQWRNFWPDGTILDLHSDSGEMEKELRKLGISNSDGWYSYLEYSRKLYNFAENSYFKTGADSLFQLIKNQKLTDLILKTDFYRPMQRGVNSRVSNKYLRDMLGFFIKYVGSSSYDAPGVLNLLAWSQLGFGLYYVEGGLYNMAKGFARLLEELKIKVHLNSEITGYEKKGDSISGINLANGDFHSADAFVSNVEVVPTHKKLLHSSPKEMSHLKKFGPACSGLVIHLGIRGEYKQLAHHNFFFSHSTKKHFNSIFHKGILPHDPTVYLVSPTVSDTTIAPKGHSIIKILPHVPVVPEDGSIPDYSELETRVYEKLESMGLVDLRKRIVYKNILTPVDIMNLYNTNRGAIYGVVSDLKTNLGFKAPRKDRIYKNLYFTGGSANPGPGTPMVTLCGQLVAQELDAEMKGF
ncbi:MAG: phytoene desaturase [Deltaproteobacteria bacterium]|nr:phytoene desaturase [Deltaproteobacteria bacterium]